MLRACSILALAATLALSSGGCRDEDHSPEGAVRLLIQAVEELEAHKAYALLSSGTRKLLARRATLATEHTGGRRQLKPEELLLMGLDKIQLEADKIEVLEQTDQRARVKLVNSKKKVEEVLALVKEDGRWRVRLDLPGT